MNIDRHVRENKRDSDFKLVEVDMRVIHGEHANLITSDMTSNIVDNKI
jgi:hypothetical protein